MTLSERTEPAKTKLCNDYTEFNDSRLCVRRDVMHELSLGCRLSDLSRVRLVYHLSRPTVLAHDTQNPVMCTTRADPQVTLRRSRWSGAGHEKMRKLDFRI